MDVRDAIHQDVFSRVYDFREFVDAMSGGANVCVAQRPGNCDRRRDLCTASLRSRRASTWRTEDAVKEGPVSRTSGEPEKQEVVDLEDGGRGEGGTREQDVMKKSTKEEDLVNATDEEKGLVKSRMKAHTRHRPTCRQCEAGHGEGQLQYGVDVNPTVCDIV
ncbi:hypothetical protein PR001_g25572 [Phytophthora rubi]|uniref:Uncharacterized protein n=1 Tax=Phytophthora rubi TaxID=129364 RepID=A0A6A3I7D9_9STRA|nr:hypothetical protein PR001_g25572 [Phytophthora rubi]